MSTRKQPDPSFDINGRTLQARLLSSRDGTSGTLGITYPDGQYVRFDLSGNRIEPSIDGSILSENALKGTGLTMQQLRADAIALMANPDFRAANVGQLIGGAHGIVTDSFYDNFRTRLQQWKPSTAMAPSPGMSA
jgi:hypothetical protein